MDTDDLEQFVLSHNTILERVDEYTLYCKYLGFEPLLRTRYSSFVRRKDSNPSFSIFESEKDDVEYFWKDSGINESGDIFKLIKIRFGFETMREVYELVDRDFNLGFTDGKPLDIIVNPKIQFNKLTTTKPKTTIRIKSKPFTLADLAFWNSFGITIEILTHFGVQSVKYLWTTEFGCPFAPMSLCFAYPVLGKYKIYQPLNKKLKFLNDFNEKCLEGFRLLTFTTDTLIVTKSYKDVMVLYSMGYEAVCPRSESVLIPNEYMNYFRSRYKRVVILFDNDMKHNGHLYKEDKVYVPIESGEKDVSDYRRKYGYQATKEMLRTILSLR